MARVAIRGTEGVGEEGKNSHRPPKGRVIKQQKPLTLNDKGFCILFPFRGLGLLHSFRYINAQQIHAATYNFC